MGIFNKGGSISAPNPASNSGGPLRGVDIYHEDSVNFSAMVSGGLSFVIIKATDGLSQDSKFAEYYAAAKAAGLKVGAYHFVNFNEDGAAQAAYFQRVLNSVGYGKTDLPPCLDFENTSGDYSTADGNLALTFLKALQSSSGRKPMIYLSSGAPHSFGSPSWLANYYLWVASYNSSPHVPSPWGSWTFWQSSGSASVPGVNNEADSDYFNGSWADLNNL